MNAAIKAALVITFIAVVALFIFFGGGAMTGLSSEDMPGSNGMRGIGWIWIYIFLSLSLSILLGWFISGKK